MEKTIPNLLVKQDSVTIVGIQVFSDMKRPYRIHVVAFIYAAVCCQKQSFTKNTAFYSSIRPGRKLVRSVKLSELFLTLQAGYVKLFPEEAKCTDDNHFARL